MAFPTDGHFLPGHGRAEKPEKRKWIEERAEGLQIAWLHVVNDKPGPTGSPVLALEFTTGARLIVMAMKDRTSQYRARLIMRFLHPPRIWTPEHERHFSCGRPRDDTELPELERRAEGQVVNGIRAIRNPTGWGCEQRIIECHDGEIYVAADDHARPPFSAELIAQWRPKSRLAI